MEQKRLAESLAKWYGTRNPFEIAENLGYIVIRVPLSGIRGFHQYIHRCHIIYIGDELSESDARFVCAHELGHALLHKGYNRIFMDTNTFFVTNRYEIEADRFAVDLLFSDNELQDFLEHPVQVVADCLGISTELAEYRLRSLNNSK